eukprot:GCRY01001689.1.p1 GENE.GCRY01001689.1~~GCRY01001689.1.p1  ORF type:complete len:184 (-),score=11.71 GCRY01001689.1:405-956(-)
MISFDYAQQILLPYSCQQVGEIYFKTGRKVQLFGVTLENLPFFFLYLIDESESIGKGADAVISMVHSTLSQSLSKVKTKQLMMQADNCSGQNKNNAFLHYMLWLVQNEFFDEVTFSFMVPGHTKVCWNLCSIKSLLIITCFFSFPQTDTLVTLKVNSSSKIRWTAFLIANGLPIRVFQKKTNQ